MIHTQDVIDLIKKRIRAAEDEMFRCLGTDPEIVDQMDAIIWEMNNLKDKIIDLEEEELHRSYEMDYDPEEMEYHRRGE